MVSFDNPRPGAPLRGFSSENKVDLPEKQGIIGLVK